MWLLPLFSTLSVYTTPSLASHLSASSPHLPFSLSPTHIHTPHFSLWISLPLICFSPCSSFLSLLHFFPHELSYVQGKKREYIYRPAYTVCMSSVVCVCHCVLLLTRYLYVRAACVFMSVKVQCGRSAVSHRTSGYSLSALSPRSILSPLSLYLTPPLLFSFKPPPPDPHLLSIFHPS